MKTYTITLARDEDEARLLELLRDSQLGPVTVKPEPTLAERQARAHQLAQRASLTPDELEEARRIALRGGDGLSIADPVAWQRAQREDVTLPGRA